MTAAATSLKLAAAERAHLLARATTLGITLDVTAVDRLTLYAALLDRWRKTSNLISCRTADELIDRHLLDALICSWPCGAATAIADLGSGAGLPGVPLAIIAPQRRTVLVEPRRRRASFLREVKRELGLSCAEVIEARAEDFDEVRVEPVDVALCRAVWSDERMLQVAAAWLREQGLLLCLRSVAHARASACGPRLSAEQVLRYHLPRGAERRIDVYRHLTGECFT